MKRSSWLESVRSVTGEIQTLDAEVRQELSALDEILFDAWGLGENIILVWTRRDGEISFLSVPHYDIFESFGDASLDSTGVACHGLINSLLEGQKFVSASDFERLADLLGMSARATSVKLKLGIELPLELISSLVARYGVSLVRERAVILIDIVGFSLHSPFEQLAMLNSLSYSVNSAYKQLISKGIRINFARSTTGDGFYLWNRERTLDANITLYKLMMLILADNALAQRKAKRFPVPKLRTAFHVGEHYEYYQVEGLNPTTFSYIIGPVTIELARIIDKALPGQILLGDFNIAVKDKRSGQITTYGTPDIIRRTALMVGKLNGLAVDEARVKEIRCYLTGQKVPGDGFTVGRYQMQDKHGVSHLAYNAKVNIHLERGNPIFLGLRHEDLLSLGTMECL